MLRPKSAGGAGAGRSFLDDLLGTDPVDSLGANNSSTAAGSRARKSVRFFDDDDEPLTSATSSRSNRPHSSTLDSLLSAGTSARNSTAETSTNRPRSSDLTSSRTAASSKADWLGLSSESEEPPRRSNTLDQQSTSARSQNSSIGTRTSTAAAEPDDWITAGLRARAAKATAAPASAVVEPAEESSSNRPSFLQSQPVAPKVQPQDPPPPSQPPPSARPWNPRTVDNFAVVANTGGHSSNAPAPTEPSLAQIPAQQQQPSGAPSSDEIQPATEVKEPKDAASNLDQVHPEKEIQLSTLADVPETSSNSAVFLQTKVSCSSLVFCLFSTHAMFKMLIKLTFSKCKGK